MWGEKELKWEGRATERGNEEGREGIERRDNDK